MIDRRTLITAGLVGGVGLALPWTALAADHRATDPFDLIDLAAWRGPANPAAAMTIPRGTFLLPDHAALSGQNCRALLSPANAVLFEEYLRDRRNLTAVSRAAWPAIGLALPGSRLITVLTRPIVKSLA